MSGLDFVNRAPENTNMKIHGHVRNGVVVVDGGAELPEGTAVTVSCDVSPVLKKTGKGKRVRFPLVRSKHPGTLNLTAERIAEILEEEDLYNFRQLPKKPER